MSSSGKLFETASENDQKFLALLAKAVNSPKDLPVVRDRLSKLPEGAVIHLFSTAFAKEKTNNDANTLRLFCQTDTQMASIWSERLKKMCYISSATPLVDGKSVPVFDHYLGQLCYRAFMDPKVSREERSKSIQLAAEHHHYHGLISKCKNFISMAKAKPDKIVEIQQDLINTAALLGHYFWSAGHFRAGRLLHEFQMITQDEENKMVLINAMLREFSKAKLLIRSEPSLAIFEEIRGDATLSEYLQSVFGVSTLEDAEDLLQFNFTKEQFDINNTMAIQEFVVYVNKILTMEEEELTSEEKKQFEQSTQQTQKLQAKSVEIDVLIQQSLLKSKQSATHSSASAASAKSLESDAKVTNNKLQ